MFEPVVSASVAAALLDRAARSPDRTAYIFLAEGEEEQERLTYAALDARARAIAAVLIRSVGTGERALLLYPPGLDFVAAFFGCLYAGVIAVPAYPPRSERMMPRLLAILADAEPAVALAAGTSLQRVRGWLERTPEGAAVSWIATDELDPAPAGWSSVALDGDAVAFLQYTSGSTSTPKGVMVTQANLVHNQQLIQDACGHSEESVFVSWLPVYHDLGLIGNLLQATWVGAPCVLMSPVAFLQKPSRWLRTISRYRGTTSGGPNFAYDLCVRRAEGADLAGIDLSSWRVAFNGAEPVLPSTLERFAAALAPHGFRAAASYPCYGLAEATLMVSGGSPAEPPRVGSFGAAALERGLAEPAEPGEPGARPLAGCGRPLGGQTVVIVNPETAEPLPSGRIGEIWIAGPSVARGYWKRPEETAEIFGARLVGSKGRAEAPAFLRTGDLGFLRGGELYVTGRIKDLIILRGRNLYPQDLELTAGHSHPDLRPGGGAAFSVESGGEERLVLVHEVRRRHLADAAEIAAAIRAALTEEHEAAVSDVVLIRPETLPRTSSGKVRRRACREAYVAGEQLSVVGRSALAAAPVIAAPVPAREDLLALPEAERRPLLREFLRRRVADALEVDPARVPLGETPSRLGLDSLAAAELSADFEAWLQMPLPVADLLADLTLADLAERVLADLSGNRNRELPPVTSEAGEGPPPASFEQERLWRLDRLDPGNPAWHLPVALDLAGRLDPGLLEQSLGELARRHDALRTAFAEVDERPVQVIAEELVLSLPLCDLSALPGTSRDAETVRLAEIEAQRPFDLARLPLARALLLRCGSGEHRLLLTVHHAICDLVSLVHLTEELAEVYGEMSAGRPSRRPGPGGGFADFARWQRRRLREEILAPHLDVWRRRLAGLPDVELPADFPRTVPARPARRIFALPPDLGEGLRTLSRGEGATLFMALLTVFDALLHLWTGEDDLVVGCPVAGRSGPATEGVAGFFAYPLPLRVDLSGDPSFRTLLGRVRRSALEAYAHAEVPFAQLAAAARRRDRSPLFRTLLGYLDRPLREVRLPGLTFGPAGPGVVATDFEMFLTFFRQGDDLQAVLGYDGSLFAPETMDLWVESFLDLARLCLADPDRPLSQLALHPGLEARAQAARARRPTIAVAATFTAEPLEEPLAFWMRELEVRARIRFAPFGQVFQELLDPGSLFARNAAGLDVLLVRFEDWREREEEAAEELIEALESARFRLRVPCLLCVAPASPTALADPARASLFRRLEERLAAALAGWSGVLLALPGELEALYPVAAAHDPHADEVGRIPYTPEMYAALATLIARRMAGLQRPPVKALVLDCDQTLWKGVCGEDGPHGIEIDPPRRALQELAVDLHRRGMLLCLCSKNNEEDVAEVFAQRIDMPLQREHIAAERINWRSKSENLRSLAEELRLGLDSFVVLDDDPVVCVEMQAACPEALVLQLPEDRLKIPRFLAHVWAFDVVGTTGEDRERTRLYQEERRRRQQREASASLAGFLAGLGLEVSFPPLTPERLARVAQLTQRTNQFNATTRRRGEAEVRELCGPGGHEALLAEVRDRFGEYGLVGLTLWKEEGEALRVDTLLLSCRAMGRGVEHRMLARLGGIARERGLRCIEVPFVPTRKNRPALDFLTRVGEPFRQPLGEGWLFVFPTEEAAALIYRPELEETTPAAGEASTADRQTGAGDGWWAARARRIALDLSTPEQVLAAVHAGREIGSALGDGTTPRTPTEELLAGIWEDLLRIEQIGVHGDFFDLGGHSLLAAQVVSRLHGALGVSLPLAALFEHPTVARLARAVDRELRGEEAGQEEPPLRRVPRDRPIPLSFAQERLWFLDRLAPGSAAYNIHVGLRLAGDLSLPALVAALAEVSHRHEALRTSFVETPEGPVQQIGDRPFLELPAVDLTGCPESLREPELRKLAVAEAQWPFDLERGPLVRATLVRSGDREHVLLLTLHHIVADGWSMGVLVREVAEIYGALVTGRQVVLPELPVQYADFAVWQRNRLSEGSLETRLDWWRRHLQEAPTVLDLPSDRPRPPIQSFRGSREPLLLDRDLVESLRSLGRREGATLYMILLAAFQILMARHSGQDDLLMGSPAAGRGRVEVEGLIGLFVNTLVLRGDLRSDPTLRELLARTRMATPEAFDRQDVPFERLVEELEPQRDPSRNPLFQVMLVLQNTPLPRLDIPGLEMGLLEVDNGTSRFDLTLSLTEQSGGLAGWIEHDADLFDGTTVRRMLERFTTLLGGFATDAERRVLELPLLSAAEVRQLLVDRNRTGCTWALPMAVHDLFTQQAGRTPGKDAAVGPQGAMTYRQLAERCTALAGCIQAVLARPLDRLVALFADPDPLVLVGMFGILRAGAGFVPLDPRLPEERLAWTIKDSACEVLITQRRHLNRAVKLGIRHVLCLEEAPPTEVSPEPWTPEPRDEAELRGLAYVVYTSGSTGRPKGVQISHQSLLPILRWGIEYFGLGGHTRVLQSLSFCFDFGIFEYLTTILAGGTLVFPGEAAGDPSAFAHEIVRQGINTLHTTPAFARAFAVVGVPLDGLKILHLGGEMLSCDTAARLREVAPRAAVFNGYGPTEATVNSSIFRIGGPGDVAWPTVPIGRSSADNALYILDRAGNLVPFGARGDLHVGGIGMARGYLNRPALTAERFLPDPFGSAPGGRLYRTGDLVRYLPSGDMEFLGRLDHQVKVRGFRIELGEIETALAFLPGVREAVVLARENQSEIGPGDRRLVAYVVGDIEVDALRRSLSERLPDYMVPAVFMMLAALPLTPNGKVDRKALPVPEWQSAEKGKVAPRTPVEEVIAGIWAEVLRLEQVGTTDHFFYLGGHSLLATRVMSRLRCAFGIEIPLRDLFETPVLAGLATRVEAALRAGAGRLTPPLARVPRQGPLPLSFAQQRLWFIDQLEPGSRLYNIPVALRVKGLLNAAVLALCLGEIVCRHEALRTVFATLEGAPAQVIRPATPFGMPIVDLSALPENRREETALSLADNEAGCPFDLARGPLLRGMLLRLAAEDHIAALTMHHIVSDGWSMGLLVHEVTALYAAFAEGRPSPLPDLPVQYADFALWQHSWLHSEILKNEISYWRQQLAGLPPRLELPADRPRPAVQSFRGASRPVRLPAELTRQAQGLSRQQGATLFMVLLAGFQTLLARYTGQQDLAVGTPVAGRNRVEIEGLIGFFVNTLVLRGDLTGTPTFRELLGRMRDMALAAYLHQDVPFEKLVEELAPSRSLAQSPLFQAMLVLQNAPMGSLEIQDLRLHLLDSAGTTAKFDLTVSLTEQDGGLNGTAEHATDLFDDTTIDRLIGHFERLLEAAVAAPEQRAAELPLLSKAELRQILIEWNDTEPVAAPRASVQELFAAQARRDPDAVAVVYGDDVLTYAGLASRADCLARHLHRLGVGPDVLVGLLVESSLDMIVGVLGILQAGGAYVPLDPGHPEQRLAFMLDDTRAPVVLTQEHLLGRVPAGHSEIVLFNGGGISAAETAEIAAPAVGEPSESNLAYVIYTSGSTGTPKGVAATHGGLGGFAQAMAKALGLGPGDRMLQFASLSFDASAVQIFPTLTSGATLVLHRNPRSLSPAEIADLCCRAGVTVLDLPAALWRQWVAERAADGTVETPVRMFLTGGETVPSAVLREWAGAAPPGASFLSSYGPTEATVTTTAFQTTREKVGLLELPEVPIGHPLAGARIYLLDHALEPVPLGVPAELFIGGPGVTRGYWRQPAMTAERFLPDPFTSEPGARLYRTGDLVYRLADRTLRFLGRADQQVKIRGFRIELGEIESALVQHPEVDEALAIVREDRPGEKRLVAYVVPAPADSPAAPDLRAWVAARLPEYMVPAAFVMLAALPLNTNGKVDRRALPAPEQPSTRESYVAPRTREEEVLARIWAQALRLPRVGVNDNFFELGGDSILSVQIVARARQDGLLFTVRQIFEHQTVAELARHSTATDPSGTFSAKQGPVTGEVPLVPIQRWFFEQSFADPHHFNQALLLESREPLAPSTLERAMAAIVEHHDALRLRFDFQAPNRANNCAADGWRQENALAEPVAPFHQVDLSGLPAPREAFERAAAALQAGFDLSAGPLTRLCLFNVDTGQPTRLLWVTHHLVVDGVSWRVLLEDLEGAYRQTARGLPPTFPPKTTSFQEWARRLAGHAGSDALALELDYWCETARVPVPRLPVDFPSGGEAGNLVGDEGSVSFELSAEETADLLQTLPSVYHNRVDDALLSALVRALAGWTGSSRLRVDLEGHGREPLFDDLDVSRTVGWFTSLYPVVLEAGDTGPGAALVSAKERLRAIPERGIGYGLLRHLRNAGDGSNEEAARLLKAAPAAEIIFNYLGQAGSTSEEASLFRASTASAGPNRSPRAHRTHQLEIGGIVADGRLRITLTYGSRTHRRGTAERLAAAYADALRQLIQHSRESEEVFTPSDFPKAGLDVRSFHQMALLLSDPIESIAGGMGLTLKNVEDIYPLTPLQSGMLFHSLMAPESGVYVNQVTCTLPADLDCRLFQQAWERLIKRHGVLRTAFLWDGLDEPRQVVRKSCALPWQDLDWRGLPSDEQQRRFEELRYCARHTPLPLTRAPLMRFSLIRLGREFGFIWTSHHLLMDGWSLPLLVRELGSIYAALREGREPALPLALLFSNYIVWLLRQNPSRAEPFWRGELAGFTAPNSLGIDHPASTEGSSGYAEHRIRVSREVTAELQALAARHKLTLQTVTLGAWAVLISRYSSEEDVVFGNVVSGRPATLPGVETLIGMFVNTLPVRVRVNDAEPLAPWLQRLQERQLARQEFEHSPLIQIQRWSELPAGSPLFETLYVFENYPTAGDGSSDSLGIGNLRSFESTNYPITLSLTATDHVSLRLTSDRARVDEDAAPRLLQHLATLLAGMAEEGPEHISEIPLLSEAERHQLETEWNDTAVPVPFGIVKLFEAQVHRSPDAIAVVLAGDEKRGLTYRDLDRRADLLAERLRTLGVGAKVPVGLCIEQTPELAVALLGIFKSGGALLALDPIYPPARLSFLLTDAAVSVLVSSPHLLESLPLHGVRTVLLEEEEATEESRTNRAGPAPGDLAYLIYTSGTTGQPKAVPVEHGMLAATLAATQGLFHFAAGDRIPCLALSTFDISLFELLSPLLTGGTAVLFPLRPTLDVELVVDHLGELTCLHAVPALMRGIIESLRRRGAAAPDVTRIRAVFIGGDTVPADLLEDLRETFSAARLWVLYGPTEGTIVCAAHPVPLPPEPARPLLGRPLAGAVLHVCSATGELLPAGVPGELWIGGAGVTRGYLDRDDLTAERYVLRDGEWFYRTGDRVRRLADGTLEFLGRLDYQVKIRGFRIELGEIEAVLLAFPGVHEAVVLAREDRSKTEPGDRRLVAYVVGDVMADALRRSLRERLPDYMVPSAFVILAALPLTSNGKVDRKALPAPEWQSLAESRLTPQTPVEDVLAGIWAELLGLERVGAADNFFNLGGHSLLATQVLSRLRGAFGVEVQLRDLFEAPVLTDLAARVETVLRAGAGRLTPPLVPVPREAPPPLSFAQQRLWFIDQLEPGRPLYNIPAALRVEGLLNGAVLALCLGEIGRRHEALRTVFAATEGFPVQVIQPIEPFLLPLVDLSGLPEREREATALAVAGEEAVRPFDLARGPLLRAVLLRLGDEEHVAALTMHHIVSDGWSMDILVREVTALYAAFAEGEPSPLPELPVQYADFAVWQASWLHGEILENEIAFWHRQLAGLPPRLELPTDRLRPKVQSFRGALQPVRLPADLTRQMQALSQHEGATLFMVLLAGFQTLLARYSGQDDLAVGSPVAGRNRIETEGLIGFFVNTLVLRGNLSGAPTFRELLGQVRETALAAYLHQDVPFEKLVEELAPERSLAQTPLFQAMLALQNAPVESLEIRNLRLRPVGETGRTAKLDLTLYLEERDGELAGTVEYATDLFDSTTIDRLPGIRLAPLTLESGTAKFDLTLLLSESGGGLAGALEYNRDLFDGATAQRLIEHFLNLLAGALADPGLRLSELPLLSPAERHQRWEWNDTAFDLLRLSRRPQNTTLPELFERQAEREPERTALIFANREMTYGELSCCSRALAAHLRRLGIGEGALVGVCMEPSFETVVGLLGILRTGAAYVPLDPEYPRERLAAMLEDVSVLLTQARLVERLPATGARIVPLDEIALEGEDEAGPGPRPDSLAYIIYTSGSTGRPKGVMIDHRGAVNTLCDLNLRFGVGPEDRVLALSSLSFDLSVYDLFGLLAAGGAVVLAPAGARRDPALWVDLVARHRVSLWNTVPALMEMLVDEVERHPETRPAGLRLVMMSGDWIPVTLPGHIRALWEGAEVISMGGATEASIWSILYPIRQVDPAWTSIPYGRPMWNQTFHVLDAALQPSPIGVPGQLFIGGLGVALGYWRDEEKTRASFLVHPQTGERLYRTGDLGRHLADGTIEFLGRADQQVKIRGFRIELGEIESVLSQRPEVSEALAIVREDRPGEKHLVAYVVPAPAVNQAAGPAAADLRAWIAARVPEYMVPSAFVRLDTLPLTANGKVDRKALPAPEGQDAEADHQAPRTPVEEVLAGIWAEVLGLERVGAAGHFFDLGGHSLLATRVMSRLPDVFGIELPLRTLFEAPMLSDLAARIEAARRSGAVLAAPPLAPLPRQGPLPLSFAQQRLWFFHQIDPFSPAYHLYSATELCGPLDIAAFGAALSEVVRRHEALRTGFEEIDGQPVQVVAPAHRVPLALIDMTCIAGHDRRAMVHALAVQQTTLPFNLSHAPLLRAYLVRFDSDHHVILLTIHHIVSDGWSMELMIREMAVLYQAFLAGCPSPLPELRVQYADFALWQRSWLSSEVMETLSHYWKSRLAGAPALLELPLDRKRAPLPDNRGALRPYTIPQDLSDSLKGVARAQRVTLFMVLLAAFKALLHSYSGQEDMVVGTNIAGRASAEVEDLIGFFINMLALRTDLSGNPTFIELLQRVREITLEAYSHQELPFEKVVDELRLERSLSHTPLFQAVLTLQPSVAPDEMAATPELTLRPIGLDVSATPFDLIFNLSKTAAGVSGSVIYNVQLFEAATIMRLMERYSALLRMVASAPERRLSEIREALFESMTDAQEREFDGAARRTFKSARRQAVALESKVSA